MKTLTGLVMLSSLAVPSTPASAQDTLQHQVERITEYALTIAADALGELADQRADRDRAGRQGRPDRTRGNREPEYTDTFMRTVRLGANGRLELDNLSGNVEVTGSSSDDVRITATRSARSNSEASARAALAAAQIEVTERPGLVRISAEPTRGRDNRVDVNYVISVPAGTSLSLKTLSGDISVKNVAGDLRLNSISGNIAVRDARPRATDVEVVSGDVSLEQLDSERVQVKSLSGDITLKGRLARTGRYELHTHSGDIQVIPEGNPGFELEAETFSGDVSSDFGVRAGFGGSNFSRRGGGARRSNDVRGSVNDGGAVLSLQSFSGDISIKKP
jgi:DUF4097 and DUF4098 domain-containing protein YvlB